MPTKTPVNTKEIKIKINLKDYPLLNTIKETELEKTVFDFFDMGYKTTFPPKNEVLYNQNIQMMVNQMQLLRKEIEDSKLIDIGDSILSKVEDIINPLSSSLNKLVGLQTASSKKGELGENLLSQVFTSRYGDIIYDDTSKKDHCGDAWITLPNKIKVMVESKNYSTVIATKEVVKMETDMKTNNIRFCLFLSLNSPIQGFREMDFHTFIHNNETYFVIMVANLVNDISKLDLAFGMIRKLSDLMNEPEKFPWIQQKIKQNLDKLNDLRNKSYVIKDNFNKLDSNINNSLDIFNQQIRDYIWDLDKIMGDFTNEIQSTMLESLDFKKNSIEKMNKYKEKSIFDVASKIGSIIQNKDYDLKDIEENKYEIFNKTQKVAKLEIQNKKAIINIIKTQKEIIINSTNKKQIIENLKILELNF